MNQERRKVIIKEIEHWQRSKLLPDQYCNFLLNLYVDEPKDRIPSGWNGRAAAALQQASGKLWFSVMAVIALVGCIVIYFNDFHPAMQMATVALGTWALLWRGQKLRKRHEASGLALIGLGMMCMLGGGLYIFYLYSLSSHNWELLYLGLCALFWISYGISARIPLLHLCGWIAAIMVYALVLYKHTTAPKWYDVQLFWMPASFLYAWGSWFVKRWSKQASAILFVMAAILWFMPEIYSILLLDNQLWIQVQLLVKMTLGSVLLFSLRKKWIAWVA
ncbi:hypothetical protein ACFOQM_18015 [Paenibacillus sp. GCM10012307]|uniref:DUF2157 domain-containing protein n=1 Tax=Paenibacillus roseus TaxID=2798579 RepID=A0A934J1L4_9BACL|nr:hypothetical protein [Paenibacillus roseus]MBJ6363122.1 hypothetical protein [Paenibacillus roseus]